MTRLQFRSLALIFASFCLSASASAANGSDIVRLKDGGLVRGTIVELVPGKTVVITSLGGGLRTFAMQDVEYAGPEAESVERFPEASGPSASRSAGVSSAPATAASVVVPAGAAARPGARRSVMFIPSEPGLRVYRQTVISTAVGGLPGSPRAMPVASFEELCTAPCSVELKPGTQALGLAREGTVPVGAAPIEVGEDTTRVWATYKSNGAKRTVGILLAVAMSVGGSILALKSERTTYDYHGYETKEIDVGKLTIGGMLTAASLLPIYLLCMTPDEGLFSLTPPMPKAKPAGSPARLAHR